MKDYISDIREFRSTRDEVVANLLGELRTERDLVWFLMNYCTARIGPLRPIPAWLCKAARLARACQHHEIADELVRAADREEEHRLYLIADLVTQRKIWLERLGGFPVSLLELVRRPATPAAEHHKAQRQSACRDPLAMVAVELELAELGRMFGGPLVERAHALLGADAAGCLNFVTARSEDAYRRSEERQRRLAQLVARHPQRVPAWADRAGHLLLGYLDLLMSCTAHGYLPFAMPHISTTHGRTPDDEFE